MVRLEKQIGERIRRLRSAAGLSIEELASSAGIHPNTLGQIERGERNPSLSVLAGVANGLKLELPTVVDVAPSANARAKTQLIKRIEAMSPAQVRALIRMLDAAVDL